MLEQVYDILNKKGIEWDNIIWDGKKKEFFIEFNNSRQSVKEALNKSLWMQLYKKVQL